MARAGGPAGVSGGFGGATLDEAEGGVNRTRRWVGCEWKEANDVATRPLAEMVGVQLGVPKINFKNVDRFFLSCWFLLSTWIVLKFCP